jgi:hypothetical protein
VWFLPQGVPFPTAAQAAEATGTADLASWGPAPLPAEASASGEASGVPASEGGTSCLNLPSDVPQLSRISLAFFEPAQAFDGVSLQQSELDTVLDALIASVICCTQWL